MNRVTQETLRQRVLGKSLLDSSYAIESPSAILDLAVLEQNCERMLSAVGALGLEWRAHVKTHKTTELTRLQVGNDAASPVNLVVSTIIEAENLVPLLKEYQAAGRAVSILYGFPLPPAGVGRLATISRELGAGSLSVMIDHPDQLEYARALKEAAGHPPLVFVKVDGGYHRAGVIPQSQESLYLLDLLSRSDSQGIIEFYGLYIHAGHSYDSRENWQALKYLLEEFSVLGQFADSLRPNSPSKTLTLSVGASPTSTSLQHPCLTQSAQVRDCSHQDSEICRALLTQLQELKSKGYRLEAHAGVYPTLDLQQLATHARSPELLSSNDIGITILADVVSLYPGRGPNGTTEALINVGCLGLGREPCKDMGSEKGIHYTGWGLVKPWLEAGLDYPPPTPDFPAIHGGWQVVKVSQEHGILGWKGNKADEEHATTAVTLISISSPVCSLVLGLNLFRFLGETTQLPLMAPSNDKTNQPAAAGQGEVILSDVIGRDKSINIFSGFTRDVACIETRLDDFKVNTTVLAPLNSAIEKLPRKPWEDPRDYGAFGADAYEGEDGIDRAQRNLRRFVESHIVPRSPWAENDKVQAIKPDNIEVVNVASSVSNGEVWIIKGVINYA
ncbi:unnamed protein product [Parascedosporium putredinis]|uniref:FAS1 domain-containing protein n=1 Tax=Parascedosporium putredinis TaxID=1442378 RepID=A0A9P1MD81_9PEZI|nr:unnamed protein product [Parascedosporium putredinis]CAI8002099.1 unnamed protein product [Parascedosporium putredinis]